MGGLTVLLVTAFTITAFKSVNKFNKESLKNNNVVIIDEEAFLRDYTSKEKDTAISYDNMLSTSLSLAETISKTEEDVKEDVKDTPDKKLTKLEKYRASLENMGMVDLSDYDDDSITIYKKPSKKSKEKGYLADGGIMTIVEESGKWYKIKSGHIKGYVRKKYVLTGDDVEETLLYDSDVTALMKKDNIYVTGKPKKDSTSVGIAYIDNEYPIVAFSENEKYAMIERTETITGWVPISAIKINIDAPYAMTEDELEDYLIEMDFEEQEALNDYLNLVIDSTGDGLTDSIITLISNNESGDYKAARNPKTSGEKTITVGAWQWYGENAHGILKQICNADSDKALKLIESAYSGRKAHKKAKELYKEITGGDNWESDRRIFTNTELIAIKNLLGSDQGVNLQNSRIQSDIQAKIKVAVSSYSLSNDALVAYFCDMFWQNPKKARAVMDECIDHFGSARKFCKADNALKYLHKQALENSTFGKYGKRRKYTYAFCKGMLNK